MWIPFIILGFGVMAIGIAMIIVGLCALFLKED